jgi:hypothetical protein
MEYVEKRMVKHAQEPEEDEGEEDLFGNLPFNEVTSDVGRGLAILHLAEPKQKGKLRDSLKLLSVTNKDLTFPLTAIALFGRQLKIPAAVEFVDNFLELSISERGTGRKELRDIAVVPEQRELSFRERWLKRGGGY